MSSVERKLNVKQLAFVDSYMQCFNAKQAAIEAGYSTKNANKVGYQVLHNENVRAVIAERMEERKKALEIVPFDTIILHLVEIVNDKNAPSNERMRAAELLIKYNQNNKWHANDNNKIQEYVAALKEQIGDVWE